MTKIVYGLFKLRGQEETKIFYNYNIVALPMF